MKKNLLFFLTFLAAFAQAQQRDSLSIRAGSTFTFASKEYQPFWTRSNRFGTISDRQVDASTHVAIYEKVPLGKKTTDSSKRGKLYLAYGADLYLNGHFGKAFFKEAYLKAGTGALEFRAGRFAETAGETDPYLSSGSLGISSNALPIPKIGFALKDYVAVPFTKDWLQVKGSYYHGWLGSAETTTGAFLHQKSLHLKGGKGRLQAYAGINHFAQWGGSDPWGGPLPGGIKDYARVVLGARGDASDAAYRNLGIDVVNAAGNHILVPEFGLILKLGASQFRLYTQTIFDKGVARTDTTRDELVGLKLFRKDRLVGLEWEKSGNAVVKKIVVESIYTMDQGGPIPQIGNDSYYNNYFYRTGWNYKDRIIGTPLFINRHDAKTRYGKTLDSTGLNWTNVVSNRVKGFHLGIKGTTSRWLDYRILATLVEHHGTYDNTAFGDGKKQASFLAENTFRLSPNWSFTGSIALDAGDLLNTIGGLVKLEWSLRNAPRKSTR